MRYLPIWVLAGAIALGLALSACVSTPRNEVAAIESGLTAADTLLLAYVRLPPCRVEGEASQPVLCSQNTAVLNADRARRVAYTAVKEAERLVYDPSLSENKKKLALATAASALVVFQGIIAGLPATSPQPAAPNQQR